MKNNKKTKHTKYSLAKKPIPKPIISKWAYAYAALSAVILLGTSFIWALLGSRVQQLNADQLVNTYLSQDWHTFQNALFPSAHTFLIKWPIFLLLHLCGSTAMAFQTCTIALTLVTVAGLAYILYRIERRPLVWGTLLLALASIFVLVPAEPYAGGLLPVNMAMIATRNIEYLWYITSLIILIRNPHPKRWGFWLAVGLMGILAASDRLFLTMSVGGAAMAFVVYMLVRRRSVARTMSYWLLMTIGAAALSAAIIWTINASGLTHVSSQGDRPFALITHPKDVVLGSIFGVLGILTNFGANPAFDAAEFRNIPGLLHERLLGISGVSFLVNLALLAAGVYAVVRIMMVSFVPAQKPKKKQTKVTDLPHLDRAQQLSILLTWSSFAAILAFVVTSHYYFVDARYLSILVFAVAISAATYLRSKTIAPKWLYICGFVLVCTTGLGFVSAVRTYHAEQRALVPIESRTALIAAALKHHPTDVIIGDYWRVVPLKTKLPNQRILPLDSCAQARQILSSSSWQADLKKHSFAYILSFDKSLTNYQNCSLNEVLSQYGKPNLSIPIAGSLDKPQELLLYYTPASKYPPKPMASLPPPPQQTNTVLPIALQDYPHASCQGPTTTLNIVAHQDDDLLFLSPDLQHEINQGKCVRTVYVTAGDAGTSQLYWLSRERGSEAAYNVMTHNMAPWIERTIKIGDSQFFSIANPQGNSQISLIFMHLPDGNVRGQGFASSHFESLARLVGGSIPVIRSVDGQSKYDLPELEDALTTIMNTFQPSEVHTQASFNESNSFPDHSDHINVGGITAVAFQKYDNAANATITHYVGYPIRSQIKNVTGQDLTDKVAAFLAYAKFDGAVCQTDEQCIETPSYGGFLDHEYTTDNFGL